MLWRRRQRETCGGCGTRRVEWQDDLGAFQPDHETCEMCVILEQYVERTFPKGAKGVKPFMLPRAEWERRDAEREAAREGREKG